MKKLLFFCFIAFVLVMTADCFAQSAQVELTSISGDVQVLLEGTEEYTEAEEGMKLEAGDKLKTGAESSAELSFNEDNSNIIRLSDNTSTEILLEEEQQIELTEGEAFSSVSNLPANSAFEIRTPTAISGARGTEWVTKVTEEGTDVEAIDAVPYVRHYKAIGVPSPDRTLVQAGQMTTIKKLALPTPPRPMLAARKEQFMRIRQDVRRRAKEAIMKRRERQPFDRGQFKEKLRMKKESIRQQNNLLRPMTSMEGNKPLAPFGPGPGIRMGTDSMEPLREEKEKFGPQENRPMGKPGQPQPGQIKEKLREKLQEKQQQRKDRSQQQQKQNNNAQAPQNMPPNQPLQPPVRRR